MLFSELRVLREQLVKEQYVIKLLNPVPPGFVQLGQTCKLLALSSGMHYLYQKLPESYPRPAYPTKYDIRKAHLPEQAVNFSSLREQAKSYYDSVVGEIYDINHLIQLGKKNGYNDFYYRDYNSSSAYRKALIEAVDNGVPTNVFYDVNRETGLPIEKSSEVEHAALVIGYAQLNKETKIILLTWNQYVAVDAVELYNSTMQLKEPRSPEMFEKIGFFWKTTNPEVVNTDTKIVNRKKIIYRQAHKPLDDAISFRGKILFLSHSINHLKKTEIKRYINKACVQLIEVEPRNNLEQLLSESEQFTRDTGIRLEATRADQIALKRKNLGIPKYLPMDVVIHFFETASLLTGWLTPDKLKRFAQEFAFNDEIIELCLKKYKTQLQGSIIDDIHRQNPDTKRSIIELVSNSCDSGADCVTVLIEDGHYEVMDNGCGMTPEIIFNSLLVPKSSTKSMGDFIGRFGIGFYTCLAHLKNENDEVIVTTCAEGEDENAYRMHFRYHLGEIEFNISLISNEEVPVGTRIRVISTEIEKQNYLTYVRQNFLSFAPKQLIVNNELLQLSGHYQNYSGHGFEMLINTETNDHGLRTVISGVLISEDRLPKKSHGLDVIWFFPSTTNITESRNAIQIDHQTTIEAIRTFIDMVDQLPVMHQVPYLNSIAAAVVQLQQRNPFKDENNNLHTYLLKILLRIMGARKAVLDHPDLFLLRNSNIVPVQRAIIPGDWKEKLGFIPPEWSSYQVTAYVIDRIQPRRHIYFDNIDDVLYISSTLYNKVRSSEEDHKQFKVFIKSIFRDFPKQSWNKRRGETIERLTQEMDNFDEYKVPRHHQLYLQHGALVNVDEKQLDALPPDVVETLLKVPTLVAKYPFRNEIKPEGSNHRIAYPIKVTTERNDCYYKLQYKDETYFYREIGSWKWGSMVFDCNFDPIIGAYGKFLVAVMRDKLNRARKNLNQDVDKLIIRDSSENFTQLVKLPSMEVLIKGLSKFSYYLPIGNTGHYCIQTFEKEIRYNLNNVCYMLYHRSGRGLGKIKGHFFILPFQEGFLSLSSCYNITSSKLSNIIYFLDQELNILLKTSMHSSDFFFDNGHEFITKNFFYIENENNVKSYPFEGKQLIIADFQAARLVMKYDDKQKKVEILTQAVLIGMPVKAVIIEKNIYLLTETEMIREGEVSFVNPLYNTGIPNEIENRRYTLEKRFVIYQNKNNNLTLMTANGQRWILSKEMDIKAIYKVDASQSFCVIEFKSFKGEEKSLLLFSDTGMDLRICKSIKLKSSSVGDFALLNNEKLINAKGEIIFERNNLGTKKLTTIFSAVFCPYIIIGFEKEGKEYKRGAYIIINQKGRLITKEIFNNIAIRQNKKHWLIKAYSVDKKVFIFDPNGLVVRNTNAPAHFVKDDDRYLWLNHYDANFSLGSRVFSLGKNSVFISEVKKKSTDEFMNEYYGSYQKNILPPKFYKVIDFCLLSKRDVINNLRFLNEQSLGMDEYSNYLRFIDCDDRIFKTLFLYMKFFEHRPSREEFFCYFKYHNLVLLQDPTFLRNAMRLIDIIYFCAAKNLDIDLGFKICDIVTIYGVVYLQQLYNVFMRERYALSYALNYGGSLNTYLAPLPSKLREIAYYLFSKRVELFSENQQSPFLSVRFSESSHSILDLIAVLSLHADLLETIRSPSELIMLATRLKDNLNTFLPKRALKHAIYHLNGTNNQVYLREFIQNALDASQEGMTVRVDLYKNKDNDTHVMRVIDTGIGMNLQTILNYLIIPGRSSKRGKKEFIGGRGVGFFSAFAGAKLLTLKAGVGDGKTYYFEFKPVLDSFKQIEDIHVRFNVIEENFKGTVIERVSHADNAELESAKTMNAIRTYARFLDANRIKLKLNNIQVNKELEFIGSIELEQIGVVSIYANAECAFTAGGLFVRNIDSDYWDCVPSFMQRELQKLGIAIELPGNISLTRERNNFYAIDKFKPFFKPLFFQLCLNAYCALLKSAQISGEHLPDDLFRYLFNSSKFSPQFKQDAERINRGELIQNYKDYLNHENCLTLLSNIKFIPYADCDKLSIVDIVEYRAKSKLQLNQLPSFIRWRLKKVNKTISDYWAYQRYFDTAKNEFEQKIKEYKNCQWSSVQIERFSALSNWRLFREIILDLFKCVSESYFFILEMHFSTTRPGSHAYVFPANTRTLFSEGEKKSAIIYFNPAAWEENLNALFTGDGDFSKKRRVLVNQLVKVISHEVAHLIEGSGCDGGVRFYTHDKSFRDIESEVYAMILITYNFDKLFKLIETRVEEVGACMKGLKRLPTTKDLMIIQILNQPDYLTLNKRAKLSSIVPH